MRLFGQPGREGEYEIVMLDETFDVTIGCWISRQIECRLVLQPGVRVTVKSRKRSNGKRLSMILVEPAGAC
jgi:hypothetical protein